ncbi:uncharacterized protein PFLUO_LOCUS3743 [Penicillium psychrofluorescens]|uniref:uncharacterized protein n=1 Tax=Penicillium psychrofluorescens TaxID=3158075 RepID=UPI003CCE3A5F
MAPSKQPGKQPQVVSFDEIIQSDRKKKKNEELASKLLGKNRRSSAPGPGKAQNAKPGSRVQNAKPGSLASRIGVAKRSVSATVRPTQNKPAPAAPSTQSRIKPTNTRRQKADQILNALGSSNPQATVRGGGSGLSIKGASGPFTVVGGNFAPGTTAADIQAAIEPTSGPMQSCRVVSHHPSVKAELVFAEKWTAENVVANFHNQRADGRVISMTFKPGGASAAVPQAQTPFDELRKQADRERRNRRAAPAVQNGSWGFGEQGDLLQQKSSGLYSDKMSVDNPKQGRQNRWRN